MAETNQSLAIQCTHTCHSRNQSVTTNSLYTYMFWQKPISH